VAPTTIPGKPQPSLWCTENSWSKAKRLSRLSRADGTFLLLALDHGMSLGPLPGIEDFGICSNTNLSAVFTGVVLNRGTVTRALPPSSRLGLVLQSFGSPTNEPGERKVRLINPEDALPLGADAIAAELHLDRGNINSALRDIAETVTSCGRLGLPILLMLSGRGSDAPITSIAHALRIATELGVDIIKIGLPEQLLRKDAADLLPLVKAIEVAPPVIFAGGPQGNDFFKMIQLSQDLGFQGLCVGRNVFQAADRNSCIEAIGHAYKATLGLKE
jgi:fructose-bisphosphate aldolase, class I